MPNRRPSSPLSLWILILLFATSALADDRDLLRDTSKNPLVFILFDTSGSMNWSPPCSQEQFDDGVCSFLCPTGDCFVPMNGDDPSSKFYQAKEALYEVIRGANGVHFGFATYNQDRLSVRAKHWLYTASSGGVTLPTGTLFPAVGDEEVFGLGWTCDNGNGFAERGCYSRSSKVADVDDPAELRRVHRIPKLGPGPQWSVVEGTLEDHFDASSFANDDGSVSWSGSWQENDGAGVGPATGNIQVIGGVLTLNDHSNSGTPSLHRGADLSAFGSATLSFTWAVLGDVETNDTVRVRISRDGGSNWNTLATFSGFNNPVPPTDANLDINPNDLTSSFRVRFEVNNAFGGSDEYFVVDNLKIDAQPAGTTVYFRDTDDERYKVIYTPVEKLPDSTTNRFGNTVFAANIEVRRCNDSGNADFCTSDFVARSTVFYDLVSDFVSWDNGADTTAPQDGFFNQSTAGDASGSNTCAGWDSNDDSSSDPRQNSSGYNLRWDTLPVSLRFDTDGDGVKDLADFPLGDLIPLDWAADQRNLILERLAPNMADPMSSVPDFRIGPYLADEYGGGESFLRLADETQRPYFAEGSTPLGNSIRDFRVWYSGCESGSCPHATGWVDTALQFDPDFNCRKKYLLVLTDGDNTCSGPSACSGTAGLRAQTGIKTYVVAFGVTKGSGSTLTCMAANGGTGEPIYPQNKDELIQQLNDIFGEIKAEARSFASASVPTVQNEAADSVYLASFTPLTDVSIWPGRLDSFRKPVPLKDDDTPDYDRSCQDLELQSACHLWNAAEEIVEQAPEKADIDQLIADGEILDEDDLRLGLTNVTRRVFYTMQGSTDAVPSKLRLLKPISANLFDEYDLWNGLGLPYTVGDAVSENAARNKTNQIIGETLKIKEETRPNPDPAATEPLMFRYVMGDIFHADPQRVSNPNGLIYFRQDLHGYQEYAAQHFWRRKMLVVGSNDAQLHFFDAGIRTQVYEPVTEKYVNRFTDGTGRELFSYIPRLAMPILRDLGLNKSHIFALDGASRLADVYIDPVHAGIPTADHRGWRTVLISGLREGGNIFNSSIPVYGFVSGYFALDVTLPDDLVEEDGELFPSSEDLIPTCLGYDLDGIQTAKTNCRTEAGEDIGFPAELWSFTDQAPRALGGPYYLDEENLDANPATAEGNGERDLGDTWSRPVIGQIRLCTGANCDPADPDSDIEERFVAIFGGGLDPTNELSSQRGAWLYMVDVETGKAIYKRQLAGAAPADPTVLDIDRDGIFDVIYIGTTLGYVYKVDLTALTASGYVPALVDVTIDNSRLYGNPLAPGVSATAQRVEDAAWAPLLIFDTGGRPIYMPITAFLVPDLEQYALAFGTGNRFNLWEFDGTPSRFYVFVDEDYKLGDDLPRNGYGDTYPVNLDYPLIDPDVTALATTSFLAGDPEHRGWIIELRDDEKVITQAFVLVGVLVFTSFSPTQDIDLDGDNADDSCARSGVSRVFVVDAENGNPFRKRRNDTDTGAGEDPENPDQTPPPPPPPTLPGDEECPECRYEEIGDFTTSPYVDQTATKNPDVAGKTTESELNADQEGIQEAIRQSLMRFFPKGCRFNRSYSLTVNASRADRGHVRYATIPIAICPIDWKEAE